MISKKIKLIALAVLSISVLSFTSEKVKVYNPERGEGKYILTPSIPDTPQIHGASVFGVRPGSPFLYTIPATGKGTLEYVAQNLPEGLTVNAQTGVISGNIISKEKREYIIMLIAKNNLGSDEKKLKIKVGDEICLTPPLGWNSWNCWGHNVTQERVLASAKAMVNKGLKDYGWSYINIDDVWQGVRGGKFNGIQSNPETFPDMKRMCDEIHNMGLKAGIYSTPWITSYAGYAGSTSNNKKGKWDKSLADNGNENWIVGRYKFEENDAKQWAAWGIDYLKYDWYTNDYESTERMSDALINSGRDIVFSTSNTCPVHLAEKIGKIANVIRTGGDLKDRWDQGGAHLNIREEWVLHKAWLEAGFDGAPGHYPDPDMLVVGHQSWGTKGVELKPSKLTADEQYSHISLWSLWSAPLLIGCPIEMMDEFTVKLLTNHEVLALQQDELCRPAQSAMCTPNFEIFVKELADGSKAVGIFNLKDEEAVLTLDWRIAGLTGAKSIRDVWRQKDIGTYENEFKALVPSHGVVLVKIK
ncbi:putative Ig domain-containing protein [Labilibacter marinus]|uniref:putative Ig domain-containing protein n=1 Tax=Labilibacter marinus TaxID=1477105 RepID=UPI0009F9FA27|nr:putative Ig domain-containing protein [Labilibacter marinus]